MPQRLPALPGLRSNASTSNGPGPHLRWSSSRSTLTRRLARRTPASAGMIDARRVAKRGSDLAALAQRSIRKLEIRELVCTFCLVRWAIDPSLVTVDCEGLQPWPSSSENGHKFRGCVDRPGASGFLPLEPRTCRFGRCRDYVRGHSAGRLCHGSATRIGMLALCSRKCRSHLERNGTGAWTRGRWSLRRCRVT